MSHALAMIAAKTMLLFACACDAWCQPKPHKCEGNLQRMSRQLLATGDKMLGMWPQVVDWDGDGAMELLLLEAPHRNKLIEKTCRMRYFRQEDGQLVEQRDAQNPLKDVAVPVRKKGGPCFSVVDWDGDGHLDLLLQDDHGIWFMKSDNGTLSNHSAVLLVNKSGHNLVPEMMTRSFLSEKNRKWMVDAFLSFEAVDWDADGDVDLFVWDRHLDWPEVHYFERKNQSTMVLVKTSSPLDGSGLSLGGMLVADWDADGEPDVVLLSDGNWMMSWPRFGYLHRTRDGHLEDWSRKAASNPFYSIEALREDGYFPGREYQFYEQRFMGAVMTAADWDGDGATDLVVATQNAYWGDDPDSSVYLFSWKPEGQLTVRSKELNTISIFRRSADPAVADWDGDGTLDLILTSRYGKVEVFLRGDGSMRHGEELMRFPQDLDPHCWDLRPAALDWNGDGFTDLFLLAGHHCHETEKRTSTIYFERQSNGSLREMWRIPSQGYCFAMTVADFDDDGDLDFLQACDSNGTGSWNPPNGQIKWELLEQLPGGSLRHGEAPLASLEDVERASGVGFFMQAVDLDSDGRLDLVIRDDDRWRLFQAQQDRSWVEVNASLVLPRFDPELKHCCHSFVFVDWDSDGDLDMLVAVHDSDGGNVRLFDRGFCQVPEACSGRGFCSKSLQSCTCLIGHNLSDCSACSRGFFDAGKVNVSDPTRGQIRQCSACPGLGEAVCSGRGICDDDVNARVGARAAANMTFGQSPLPGLHGNGTCSCKAPFHGERCEQGLCPPGHKYVKQGDLRQCELCEPGFFMADYGLQGYCASCTKNTFASLPGSSHCIHCEAKWWRTEVNADRTRCQPSFLNVPVCALLLLLSFLLVSLLQRWLLGPIRVEDVQLKAEALCVTTRGRHYILKPARIVFKNTGHPCLDSTPFIAKVQNDSQLVLCDLQGVPVVSEMDASQGTFSMSFMDKSWQRGLFNLPFAACFGLLLAAVVVALVLVGKVFSDTFRLSLLELGMIVCGGSIAALVERLFRPSQCPIDRDLKRFAAQIDGVSKHCPKGAARAITLKQILELYQAFKSYIGHRNMYYICSNILKPLTRKEQLSYAELVGPTPVRWFVSHFWGMPFGHFMDCLSNHNDSQRSYWICTFANNQWKVEEELGNGVMESSFYLALCSETCCGTLFVLDEQVLPFTRSWCLFELFQTETLNRAGAADFQLLLGTSAGVLNYGQSSVDLALKISKKLSTLRLQDATASNPQDKAMIDAEVSKAPGGFQAVNAFLIKSVQGALRQTENRFQHDFAELQEDLSKVIESQLPTLLGSSGQSSGSKKTG